MTTRVDGLVKEVERLWNGSPSITTTTYDILDRLITLEEAKTHGRCTGCGAPADDRHSPASTTLSP